MKSQMKFVLPITACLVLVAVAFAQEPATQTEATATAEKTCCSKEKTCCSKEACSSEMKTAMAKLPKMSYEVAGEATCCAGSAAKLAETKDAAIEYVVGEQKFETKQAAYTSLVEQTEAMVTAFVTPCKCEVSGTTKIAGTTCNCPVKAGETTELVSNAIKGVEMTYAVGEETCNCPNKAKMMAEEAGAERQFVVNGEKTSCELTARLKLAQAKYAAAVAAMVASSQPAEQAEANQESGT